MPTRALLLSAYIKFINLFPETKATIQEVLRSDSQIRNSDVELQQRAVEYLKLSSIASTDVLVSVAPLSHPQLSDKAILKVTHRTPRHKADITFTRMT